VEREAAECADGLVDTAELREVPVAVWTLESSSDGSFVPSPF